MKNRILFFITEDWYFLSHRLPLAQAALYAGYDVGVVTHVNEDGGTILKSGIRLIPFNISRRSMNPFSEVASLFRLAQIYQDEKPDIVHHVAMKPVLYGSLAAKLTGVPYVVNALTGLGYVYSSKNIKAKLLRPIISTALRALLNNKRSKLILQNQDDQIMLKRKGLINEERIRLIKGSGVDIKQFMPLPESEGAPTILLASRMLWNKGIGEFIDAARTLKKNGVDCNMILAGKPDFENPAAIPEKDLHAWHAEGIIEWLGQRGDMPKIFAQSNIVVLPTTYGEGVPKVLIEAASCGRAIIATDVPGCREIVRHNENGLLIPPGDSKALADAIMVLIKDPALRANMGKRGREIVEAEFSQEIVVRQTLGIYEEILNNRTVL